MHLATFRHPSGSVEVGARRGDVLVSLTRASGHAPVFASMQALIEAGRLALADAQQVRDDAPDRETLPLADVCLLAPVPRPPRMRACSLDARHLIQAKAGIEALQRAASASEDVLLKDLPEAWYRTPVYWFMDPLCLAGPDETVTWPGYSTWVDYELEIAAVIGSGGGSGSDIAVAEADEYIFGYTILNDLSARDAQIEASATGLTLTAKGKDFAGSYPMGPFVVTHESADYRRMEAILRVNGEEWARGTTAGAHYSFADAIAYASRSSPLVPGEILSSATVANCSGLEARRKGARGDLVELEVPQIGTLATRIV